MIINIRASDVAACIGMNRYKSVEEMLKVYVGKCQGDKLDHSFDITKGDLVKLIEKVDPGNKDEIEKCKSEQDYNRLHQKIIKSVSSKSVWANTNEESKVLESKINEDLPEVCKKCIQTEINTKRGIVYERKNLNNYERSNNKMVGSRNSKLYRLVVFEEGDLKLQISGKIDGIEGEGGGRVLIETKNRRNRLFDEIPLYEKVQMSVYMKMTDIKTSKMLQYYNDEEGVIDYDYDEDFWEEIQSKLLKFKDNILCFF
jgi:hypothetical protein